MIKRSGRLLLGLAVLGAATLPARESEAFCGFYVAPQDGPIYNDASMVTLMRDGTRTVMSMSNNYKGPASDFAMVVPVPVVLQKDNVKTLPAGVFTKLEALSAPRLVEYWEQDPCPAPGYYGPMTKSAPGKPMAMAKKAAEDAPKKDYGVKIEAQFSVGEYDIVILSAKESDGLERWLIDNKYKIPKGAQTALAPYIKEQQKFFVAKVDIKKVKMDAQGVAVLSPLRFSYESQDFRLPVRLGLLNAKAKQDLIVYILAKDKRYESANYPNVTIPTNLEVSDDTRKSFGPFYAALFDEAVSRGQSKAIVTEYSWMSSSCDPCPTPPLDGNTLATLGGDVLFGMGTPPPPPPPPTSPPGGPPSPMKKMPPGKPMPGGFFGGGTPMVLTRLHARYDATSLSDDIVFRSADPIVGGREHVVDDKGNLEKGAVSSPGGINNFQARYIIRHPWTGPIKCQNPVRGVWGGPPGSYSPPPPAPATNLAGALRGSIKLTAFLKKGMPEFEVKAALGIPAPPMASIAPPSGDDAGVVPDDAAAPAADASVPPPAGSTTVAPVAPSSRGCGCRIEPATAGDLAGFGIVFVAGASAFARRRRKR